MFFCRVLVSGLDLSCSIFVIVLCCLGGCSLMSCVLCLVNRVLKFRFFIILGGGSCERLIRLVMFICFVVVCLGC